MSQLADETHETASRVVGKHSLCCQGSKTGGSSKTMLFRVTESVTQIVKVACSALESLSLTKSALHLKRLTANETSRHDLKSSIPKVP